MHTLFYQRRDTVWAGARTRPTTQEIGDRRRMYQARNATPGAVPCVDSEATKQSDWRSSDDPYQTPASGDRSGRDHVGDGRRHLGRDVLRLRRGGQPPGHREHRQRPGVPGGPGPAQPADHHQELGRARGRSRWLRRRGVHLSAGRPGRDRGGRGRVHLPGRFRPHPGRLHLRPRLRSGPGRGRAISTSGTRTTR